MIVVSDATPLIHMAKVKSLNLIKELYQKCYLTESVYNETVIEGQKYGHDDSNQIMEALGDWIEVRDPKGNVFEFVKKYSIHVGEATSILLAKELSALLLINERDGREAAKIEGVEVKGTIGIIATGVKENKLSYASAIKILESFASEPSEFWLEPRIVRLGMKMISEIVSKK